MFWRKDAQKDKRRYIRVEKAFRIKYGIIKIDNMLPVKYDMQECVELKYDGYTKDISQGGLCLQYKDLNEPFSSKKGAELKLKISIPNENPEDVDASGRVAWEDLERKVCGIEFTSILYEDRLKIRNYVRDEYFKSYKK
ncbi:MAG: PilZ domain-containing protein [bacterium]